MKPLITALTSHVNVVDIEDLVPATNTSPIDDRKNYAKLDPYDMVRNPGTHKTGEEWDLEPAGPDQDKRPDHEADLSADYYAPEALGALVVWPRKSAVVSTSKEAAAGAARPSPPASRRHRVRPGSSRPGPEAAGAVTSWRLAAALVGVM